MEGQKNEWHMLVREEQGASEGVKGGEGAVINVKRQNTFGGHRLYVKVMTISLSPEW